MKASDVREKPELGEKFSPLARKCPKAQSNMERKNGFRALLLFVVLNKVELYRQVKNSTCLELAKPSNQQSRLPCNNTSSVYHCLLDQSYTREYEICEMWKWIPEGNCAHFNTYKGNIDAMSCSSSAQFACPGALYQSRETTKYAACYVKATSRQVKNTTCLELAKPSNEENRLTCNNSTKYHCLLDGNKTNEYEICRVWKWVPKGNCAYFNKYSGGNIDIRKCTPSSQFVCAEKEYSSRNNTLYPACYVKKTTTSITTETTSSFEVTTEVTSDNRNSTAYPISDTTEKQSGIAGMTSAVIFGAISPILSIAVIYFFYQKRHSGTQNDMGLRGSYEDVESQEHRQENAFGSTGENELNNGALQSQNSENDSNEDGGPQEQQLINNVNNSGRHSQHLVNDSSEETEPPEHQPLIENNCSASETVNNSGRHSQHLVNDSSEETEPPEHQPLIGNNCSTSETGKTNVDEFTEPTSDERTVSEEVNSTVRESELKTGKTITE